MAIVVTDIAHNSNTTGATVAATVPAGGVPTGALIVVVTQEVRNAAPGGSVTDTATNAYTSIVAKSLNNTQSLGFATLWYAKNVTALVSTNTITYNKTGTAIAGGISCFYATGIDTAAPLDTAVTNSATGTGNANTVTSGTPSVSGELFIAAIVRDSGTFTQDSTHSWATPFTADTATTGVRIGGGNQVNSGTGTIIFSPTLTGAPNWASLIAGFKPVAPKSLIIRPNRMIFMSPRFS